MLTLSLLATAGPLPLVRTSVLAAFGSATVTLPADVITVQDRLLFREDLHIRRDQLSSVEPCRDGRPHTCECSPSPFDEPMNLRLTFAEAQSGDSARRGYFGNGLSGFIQRTGHTLRPPQANRTYSGLLLRVHGPECVARWFTHLFLTRATADSIATTTSRELGL